MAIVNSYVSHHQRVIRVNWDHAACVQQVPRSPERTRKRWGVTSSLRSSHQPISCFNGLVYGEHHLPATIDFPINYWVVLSLFQPIHWFLVRCGWTGPTEVTKNWQKRQGWDSSWKIWSGWAQRGYPLVMTNIAIEHGPFIVDLPTKDGDCP